MPDFMALQSLPAPVRGLLGTGSVGKAHLMRLADETLSAGSEHLAVGADMLLAAWEADPLDGALAATLCELHARLDFLAPEVAAMAGRVRDAHAVPESLRYLENLRLRRETDKIHAFVERQLVGDGANPFWLQQALSLGVYAREFDWVASCIDRCAVPGIEPLLDRLRGDTAFFAGDHAGALEAYARSRGGLALASTAERLGEALARCGRAGECLELWREVLRARPWHTGLLLRAHDRLTDAASARRLPEGRGAVLLYTWNKAAEIDLTLQALAESRVGEARIVVLDNGCTDDTRAVLSRWADQFGGALTVMALPVNVGAPAARNWLLHAEPCADRDWLAYLDDDALVPADWLERLGAAMTAYPEAGVWGCRVMDPANPAMFQCTDLHLADPEDTPPPGGDPAKACERTFGLSNLQHQVMDLGQFDYLRPCVSVTGCCHLFLRDRLLECGDFDLRFSPSQYDDLEHDLRGALGGRMAVYQGHLAVDHLKRSGRASQTDPREFGNAFANNYKVHMKYARAEMDALRAASEAETARDLATKAVRLAERWV